jgi:hypothetical protein
VDLAGLFVHEMMMITCVRVEDDAALGEHELPQQPLLYEQVERVVNGGSRYVRESLPDAGPDLVGRRVILRVQDVLGHGHPLRGWIDPRSLERGCLIEFHAM